MAVCPGMFLVAAGWNSDQGCDVFGKEPGPSLLDRVNRGTLPRVRAAIEFVDRHVAPGRIDKTSCR